MLKGDNNILHRFTFLFEQQLYLTPKLDLGGEVKQSYNICFLRACFFNDSDKVQHRCLQPVAKIR